MRLQAQEDGQAHFPPPHASVKEELTEINVCRRTIHGSSTSLEQWKQVQRAKLAL